MAEDEQESPEALKQRLEEYHASLNEVNIGLKLAPDNEELIKLRNDVLEVIAFTENSLRKVSQSSADRTPPAAAGIAASAAEKALIGDGDKVFAIYSADGLWYEGVVKEVHASGNVTVVYAGYGNSEERELSQVRKADGSITLAQLNAASADSKKRTNAAWDLPSKDPAKAKAPAKKKKEDPAVQAWKQFANKAPKLKSGTGIPKRKESIFRSPEDPMGKVGVTGSGKPMTKYTETRQKWDKLKDPNALGSSADVDD